MVVKIAITVSDAEKLRERNECVPGYVPQRMHQGFLMHTGEQRVLIAHSVGCSGVLLSLVEAYKRKEDIGVDAILFVDPVLGAGVTGGPSLRLPAKNPKIEEASKPKVMCAQQSS
jgi:predicted alpha/beta hydrolase family esterase